MIERYAATNCHPLCDVYWWRRDVTILNEESAAEAEPLEPIIIPERPIITKVSNWWLALAMVLGGITGLMAYINHWI